MNDKARHFFLNYHFCSPYLSWAYSLKVSEMFLKCTKIMICEVLSSILSEKEPFKLLMKIQQKVFQVLYTGKQYRKILW